MNVIEFFLIFAASEASADATMEVCFSDGTLNVKLVKFAWNDLPRLFEAGATHGLEQMTFDEHLYRVRSIQINYEKKHIRITTGVRIDPHQLSPEQV